jgi:hypothetical protein
VKEMVASGDLQAKLPKKTNGSHASLDDRLKALINTDRVMLFMKGSPDNPKCGFSKSIVTILNDKQ